MYRTVVRRLVGGTGVFASYLRLIVCAGLVLFVAEARGQTFTVEGRLVTEDGEALQLVNVTIDSLGLGTIANLDGRFRLDLPPGRHRLSVRAIGFMPYDTVVNVLDAPLENLVLRIRTKEHVITEAVVIKAREN
ncbi:MAG: carboxypeptidase-like regulatory domain-containing protein, partial [Bacteroidia bacterium]|nr:carboxypeptidase-like regulatory domain-containing protein [Bacteroidia bacterium]